MAAEDTRSNWWRTHLGRPSLSTGVALDIATVSTRNEQEWDQAGGSQDEGWGAVQAWTGMVGFPLEIDPAGEYALVFHSPDDEARQVAWAEGTWVHLGDW